MVAAQRVSAEQFPTQLCLPGEGMLLTEAERANICKIPCLLSIIPIYFCGAPPAIPTGVFSSSMPSLHSSCRHAKSFAGAQRSGEDGGALAVLDDVLVHAWVLATATYVLEDLPQC